MNNNKSIELEKFRELMINSCITAGAELNKLFLSRSFSSTIKGNNELVTGADIISENILIESISNYNFNIISEECGKIDHDSEYTFIIDPLCGTVNFAKNIGHSAISIALQHNSQIIVGVVYDFIRNDIYSAILNEGSFINEKKLYLTNSTNNITRALICISDMDGNVDVLNKFGDLFRNIVVNSMALRVNGSANLDICHVVINKAYHDAYIKPKSRGFDYLASCLIAREAGGIVMDFNNNHIELCYKEIPQDIIVSSPTIYNQIIKIIKNMEINHES